ncbi:MAG: NrfD/PsrC family molybdoenzyme membrane anchor subunit [Candidatus Kariarchaeaceae archaeon]|jgi:molybdopterin-containing oxidoreductase family membrane subunit
MTDIITKPLDDDSFYRKRLIVEKTMLETGPKTIALMLLLAIISGIGIYKYTQQFEKGLTVTGLTQDVFWGFYLTNFVFFIGISHAGTLISAILRVTGADWRTPITRLAEEITVIALVFGIVSVIIDMGRMDRVHHVVVYGRIVSPLTWDVISISFYLIGSWLFLYLPLIPDLAYYRDNLSDKYRVRKFFYRILALGWQGNAEQREILEKNIRKMSYIIIPVAVSVHTVVSWIMSLTWRVGWRSTIFGPYFVIGAIFSGLATLLMAMVAFTVFANLEEFITREHFVQLSKLLFTFTVMYMYFSISEYLTIGYTSELAEIELLHELLYGDYALLFWYFMLGGLIIPAILLLIVIFKDTLSDKMTLLLIFIAATMINLGMWLKRFLITVPTLARPTLDEGWHQYTPTEVELWILVSKFASFILFFIILMKLFPIISLWEVEEEYNRAKLEGKSKE